MASTNNLFIICLLLFVYPSIAKSSFKPKALIIPVFKGDLNLHIAHIIQTNPLRLKKLAVDLGSDVSWIFCGANTYSTYKYDKCNSSRCKLAKENGCGLLCYAEDGSSDCIDGDSCVNLGRNSYGTDYAGGVTHDVILVQSTNGSSLGKAVTVPEFIFSCVPGPYPSYDISGLPDESDGFGGFGGGNISLPAQLARAFSISRKFGMCLSSISNAKGFIIFGDGPYITKPNIDVATNLIYTPLITNPFTKHTFSVVEGISPEYFIGVTSIKINGEMVKLNTSLLSIDKEGNGGTRISSIDRYTYLEPSIYKAVTEAFIKHLPNATRVRSYPMDVCFNSTGMGATDLGPTVPTIDFVFKNPNVYWRIYGANSMIKVEKDVWCLGFLYQNSPWSSITIGTSFIEDNFLQFDLERSRVGFSSSLLLRKTKCNNFNFTSHS